MKKVPATFQPARDGNMAKYIKAAAILVFGSLLCILCCQAGAASIKAYCDGTEATVDNISIVTGQRFTVDVHITVSSDATIYLMLYEPGYIDAYRRVSGDKTGAVIVSKSGGGVTSRYRWTLAPSGKWTNGTAPVNVAYKILEDRDGSLTKKLTYGDFTVVNYYITGDSGNNIEIAAVLAAICIAIMAVCLRLLLLA
ncbi:hypothetical protein CUJ83_14885 [Methanocella sp. CWC-04]|uniref:Uncharacterized protein n=1 Tax=Methanooceanicella nereidis TaxID=2052831 RepID=A0AAP2RGC5_9EURY|nr:sarcinarray family MAST domain-containing protein [Methanocella sp. CWC-04]MCD1296286.1 hypothetical protein [Methanocella sp. CWC-04]